MRERIGRLWRAGAQRLASAPARERMGYFSEHTNLPGAGADGLALPDPTYPAPLPPEQPVLLTPTGRRQPVHVGEVLPARRQPWSLTLVRLPAVPKRAILAVGVCAGLAAPGLARHLVTRVLFGRPVVPPEGVVEVTRIVYSGPLNSRAAAAIEKVLAAGRR